MSLPPLLRFAGFEFPDLELTLSADFGETAPNYLALAGGRGETRLGYGSARRNRGAISVDYVIRNAGERAQMWPLRAALRALVGKGIRRLDYNAGGSWLWCFAEVVSVGMEEERSSVLGDVAQGASVEFAAPEPVWHLPPANAVARLDDASRTLGAYGATRRLWWQPRYMMPWPYGGIELPTMRKFARGGLTISNSTTLAQMRAQCSAGNEDTAYAPPAPITTDYTAPDEDDYIIQQRFLLRSSKRWEQMVMRLPAGADDAVVFFLLRSDAKGALDGAEIARAGQNSYSNAEVTKTVNIATTEAVWGQPDANGHYWALLEVYNFEQSGGEQFDSLLGYTPEGGSPLAPRVVNAAGGVATLNPAADNYADSLEFAIDYEGTDWAPASLILRLYAGAGPAGGLTLSRYDADGLLADRLRFGGAVAVNGDDYCANGAQGAFFRGATSLWAEPGAFLHPRLMALDAQQRNRFVLSGLKAGDDWTLSLYWEDAYI